MKRLSIGYGVFTIVSIVFLYLFLNHIDPQRTEAFWWSDSEQGPKERLFIFEREFAEALYSESEELKNIHNLSISIEISKADYNSKIWNTFKAHCELVQEKKDQDIPLIDGRFEKVCDDLNLSDYLRLTNKKDFQKAN